MDGDVSLTFTLPESALPTQDDGSLLWWPVLVPAPSAPILQPPTPRF